MASMGELVQVLGLGCLLFTGLTGEARDTWYLEISWNHFPPVLLVAPNSLSPPLLISERGKDVLFSLDGSVPSTSSEL